MMHCAVLNRTRNRLLHSISTSPSKIRVPRLAYSHPIPEKFQRTKSITGPLERPEDVQDESIDRGIKKRIDSAIGHNAIL
ncbi:predicted protein [Plenodomus lingam JN3]|uniref:Predicted protein n=1 Tax=Leptosphaeria maculans (strain JN3 / isolate v23.1.3 / race Av1-4-5-6-7-8) TaxID=985895 RepID=E4ZHG4_LEPMJ|nr:predicted protein [Plenodomus lingam JN3]CBX90797.1 predicted protein [Plenodomus lingam JN3]